MNRTHGAAQSPGTARRQRCVSALWISLAFAPSLFSPHAAYAQDWVDEVTGRIERHDFEAKAPMAPNRYLLPDDVGPARRFDFSAAAPFQIPKDLPPDFDPKATLRLNQLHPIEPKPEPPKEATR